MDPKELLQREVSPDLYREIRELWKQHSLAEDRRDIPGLLATLTDDCVYEVPQKGALWRGHEGAARFYRELLEAFPDVKFDLASIVIGPQGVCEEARLTATPRGPWLGYAPRPGMGRIGFAVIIFFPWDPGRRKFSGERVFFDEQALRAS